MNVKRRPKILTVPHQYKDAVGSLFIRNARVNLFTRPKQKSTEDVRKGFAERYRNNDLYGGYLDGAIDWYLSPLSYFATDCREQLKSSSGHILDLGCGPGSVGYWMRAHNVKSRYTGVDIAAEAAHYFENIESASFIHKDITELTDKDIDHLPVSLITTVNTLFYLRNKEFVLRKLHKFGTSQTRLIIIDAYPSLYWSPSLPGKIMKPNETMAMLERAGWSVEKRTILSVFGIGPLPLMKLAQAYLCAPIQK